MGCTLGLVIFGWLRYDWVKHTVGWRPEFGLGQYILPSAMCVAFGMLIYSNRNKIGEFLIMPALRHIWLVGAVGALLALSQWMFSPTGPWLLYAWIGTLALATWLIAPMLRLRELSNKQTWLCVLVATACMVVIHVIMQFQMWHDLSFGYRDIGLFVRALHNAAAGNGLWVDSLDRSILGEHAFFALWILVPLCKIGVDPFSLLVILSSLCLNGSALIVCWFVQQRIKSNAAALLASLSWLLLPFTGCLVLALGYGFHAIYMAVPFLLLGMSLTALRRYRSAAVAMLMAMAVREDIAMTVMAWSIFLVLVSKRRMLGTIIFIASIAYFALAIYFVVPLFRGAPYPHIAFHMSENLLRFITIPKCLINLSFLFTLMIPMAALPLRHWKWSCIAIPSIAETLLTTNTELHNLCFQYYTPAIPVLFIAGLETWKKRGSHDEACGTGSLDKVSTYAHSNTPLSDVMIRHRMRFGWCLLVSALAGQVYLGIGPLTNNPPPAYASAQLRSESVNITHLRSLIPTHASVSASYRIASFFMDYGRLFTIRNDELGDYIVIDDRDNWDASDPRRALIRAHRTDIYRPIFADYHLIALVRSNQSTPLSQKLMPSHIPDHFKKVSNDVGQSIEWVGLLLRLSPDPVLNDRKYHVSLIWKCNKPIDDDYRFGLVVDGNEARWGPFFFARGAYPTAIWKPGQLYRDDIDIIVSQDLQSKVKNLRPVLLY